MEEINYYLGNNYQKELKNNYYWLIVAGVSLFMLSIFIAIYSFRSKNMHIISAFFSIAGIIMLIHAFKFWYRKKLGFILHILSAIIFLMISASLLINKLLFYKILLYILTLSFFTSGLFRIILGFKEKSKIEEWFWTLVCGLVDLLLLFLILFNIMTPIPYIYLVYTAATDIFFTGIALFALGVGYNAVKK